MDDKLVVFVMGLANSGKSSTWNELFGEAVRTGSNLRDLPLTPTEWINDVFLVSGSPEEREKYVSEIIGKQKPRVVLCSIQYVESVKKTIDYFVENNYQIYCQWLNPGYKQCKSNDDIELISYLLQLNATITVQSGANNNKKNRVQKIREFIYGWAQYRDLIINGD